MRSSTPPPPPPPLPLATTTLRFRLDAAGQRAARRPAVGHRRHGPADLPGRGPVVLDHPAGAAGGPDDHLVEQRRLVARTGPVDLPVVVLARGRRQRWPTRLFRITFDRLDRRVFRRRRRRRFGAVVRLRRLGRPAALVVVHHRRPAVGVPRCPRRQNRHGSGQRTLLGDAAERVVPRRQLLSAGCPPALRSEHRLVQLPGLRDFSDCSVPENNRQSRVFVIGSGGWHTDVTRGRPGKRSWAQTRLGLTFWEYYVYRLQSLANYIYLIVL